MAQQTIFIKKHIMDKSFEKFNGGMPFELWVALKTESKFRKYKDEKGKQYFKEGR